MTGSVVSLRWWRLGPWSANPLMRRSDRIESAVVLVIIVVVLMLVPVAGAVGTATYTRLTDQAHLAADRGRQVSAVLLDDPRPQMGDTAVGAPTGRDQVHARWVVDGAEHTGLIDTGVGARAGQTVMVWVNDQGNYMDAPNTGTENALDAVGAALAFLVLGTGGGGLLLIGFHCLMAKRRAAGWAREWRSIGRSPGASAGR
ncbi:hypothetical protein ACFTWF_44060 [Rhodococcus sp. NPDC056960]|uniref:Rv1733c family protein n=1 Tax=Rhodococcus sp. NPDC056960 TaxID=3345982 RepID=UPI00362A4778